MRKILKLIAVISSTAIMISCNAQNKEKERNLKTISSEKTEGTNPRIKTKVNKQYDSKGHIVKFDSTYSYYYTSKGFDSTKVKLDTIIKEFKSFYTTNLITGFNKRLNDIFLADSLFKYDFLNKDYFRKRFELNAVKMNELFREMDSLKTNYLKLIQPEKPVNKKKTKN